MRGSIQTVGFVGLGHMGGPISKRIYDGGYELIAYDIAGTEERAPKGAHCAQSVGELVEADVVFLSLPNGQASKKVCSQLANVAKTNHQLPLKAVVDLSTIGVQAAQACHEILDEGGIAYVDAPVSGGQRGAKAGTLTLMVATESEMLEYIRPVLSLFSKNIFHIGRESGQGQAMKLINNFLAGSVLAVTTEALLAGMKAGLDLKQMIDVINVSTGQNFMTSHVFPESILTEQFDSGFMNTLLLKDLTLYAEMVKDHGWPDLLCSHVLAQWKQFEQDWPAKDVTQLFNYLRNPHQQQQFLDIERG